MKFSFMCLCVWVRKEGKQLVLVSVSSFFRSFVRSLFRSFVRSFNCSIDLSSVPSSESCRVTDTLIIPMKRSFFESLASIRTNLNELSKKGIANKQKTSSKPVSNLKQCLLTNITHQGIASKQTKSAGH